MMKKRFSAVICFILVLTMCAFTACVKPEPPKELPGEETYEKIESYKYTYQSLGKDVFPIGAWMAPPYDNDVTPIPANYITDAAYKDVADSGINSIYALYDKAENTSSATSMRNSNVLKALEYATKYNLAYLARDTNEMALMDDEDAQKMAEGVYKDFQKFAAFEGLMVIDEPGRVLYDNLKEMKKNYTKYFNDKLFYVNMMPTYASKNQLMHGAATGGGGASTLEDYNLYVDEYLAKVKPQVFSYDFYPMMGNFPNIEQGYFKNMSLVRKKTAAEKIPFWTFIQNTSWGSGVRICTQEEIDWQVNTSLAYGAKGIQYFTYWTPFDDAGTSPGFYPSRSAEEIGAMVSPTGEKQDMYYRVQKTNQHLKKVGNILINCGFGGIIQNGNSPDEIPLEDKIASFRQLQTVSGDDAIIGCFDKDGKTVLYVVNNSITKTSANITLKFKKDYKFNIINNAQSKAEEGATLSLSIAKGCGALIEIL